MSLRGLDASPNKSGHYVLYRGDCPHCGTPVYSRWLVTYCSRACRNYERTYTKRPIMDRIDEKILTLVDVPCWFWMGATTLGYGKIGTSLSKSVQVHRITYAEKYGPIAKGLEPDHLCRHTYCPNPDHLELVSHRENVLRGESPPAKQARQTHCLNGHPLAGDNLYSHRGKRHCRACHAERERKRRRYVS